MLYLYKTDAEIAPEDSLVLVWYALNPGDPSGMEAAMSLSSSPDVFQYVEVPAADTQGWNEFKVSLGSFAGATMAVAGINFTSASPLNDFEALIGRLGVIRGSVDIPEPPSGLYVDEFNQLNDTTGTIRLRWDHSPSDVYTYNIYRLNADDSRTFLWATPNNACFVPEVIRPLSENQTVILVESVSPEFGFSTAVSTTIDWETTGIEGCSAGLLLGAPPVNPVTGSAVISFSLPSAGAASLMVYDLSGRVVQRLVDSVMQPGEHSVNWNTRDLPSGVYMYRLESSGGSVIRKCMVL